MLARALFFPSQPGEALRTKKVCIQFPRREALIAEPVLKFPTAQRSMNESLCWGKASVGLNLEVTDFLHKRLLGGAGRIFLSYSRPSAKTLL